MSQQDPPINTSTNITNATNTSPVAKQDDSIITEESATATVDTALADLLASLAGLNATSTNNNPTGSANITNVTNTTIGLNSTSINNQPGSITSNVTNATSDSIFVTHTMTEWLDITLYGIHKLENEEEWSNFTAEYITEFYFIEGGVDVSDAVINITVEDQKLVYLVGDDLCGCPQCTSYIFWSTKACNGDGNCDSTCGEHITFKQNVFNYTEREACSQAAGLEYKEQCGKCDPLTCQSDTYCGCPQCTDDVWSTEACDEDGFCSTCGERITYLYSVGNLERNACIQTAGIEFPDECGLCNPETCNEPSTYCGCPACDQKIWEQEACDESGFCSSCGERINFIQSLGKSQRDACVEIGGNQYGDDCGKCNPAVCNTESSISTEDITFNPNDVSVNITFSQTITYNTSNIDLNNTFKVFRDPFSTSLLRVAYVSHLQSKSSNYDNVISVTPVLRSPARPPPTSPEDIDIELPANATVQQNSTAAPTQRPTPIMDALGSFANPQPPKVTPVIEVVVDSSKASVCSSGLLWIVLISVHSFVLFVFNDNSVGA